MAYISKLLRKTVVVIALSLYLLTPIASAKAIMSEYYYKGEWIEYYIFDVGGLHGQYRCYKQKEFKAEIKYEFENEWRKVTTQREKDLYYIIKEEAKK